MAFNVMKKGIVWEECSQMPHLEPHDVLLIHADFADKSIDWTQVALKAPQYILHQYATKVHQPSWLLSVLANYITHRLLAYYATTEHIDEVLHANENGKPYIAHPTLQFNLSHTKQTALIGLAHTPLGIDVEWLHPHVDMELVLPTIANKAEQNRVYMAENPLQAFYTLWTQKEAYLKALGVGLVDDLHNVLDDESIKSGNWFLETFILSSQLIGTVCRQHRAVPHYYKLNKCMLKNINIL